MRYRISVGAIIGRDFCGPWIRWMEFMCEMDVNFRGLEGRLW